MSLDSQKVAECRAWVGVHGPISIRPLSYGPVAQRPRPDTALFYCQQVAEEAWKAFLFWHDVPFVRPITSVNWARLARVLLYR